MSKRPYLDQLVIGDLVWLPKYGDNSPVWLVIDLNVEEIPDTVKLMDLEDCYIQVLARLSLNEGMALL